MIRSLALTAATAGAAVLATVLPMLGSPDAAAPAAPAAGAPAAAPARGGAVTGGIPLRGLPAAEVRAQRVAAVRAAAARRTAKCVADLPLEVRVGQTMLIITTRASSVAASVRAGRAAGTLAAGNLTPARAAAFRGATSGTRYGAILAADEEGGLVQRYRSVIGRLPAAAWQADHLTPAQVRALYRGHGRKLRGWGVDMVLAPVADVGHGPGITSRAYSADPSVVATYAAAASAGYREAGLLPVLKHFPGHGRTTADSHTSASRGPGIASLRTVDLVPYRSLLDDGAVGVLVAHVQVPGLTKGPSSLSRAVIGDLLRTELGHRGLVISDGLGMAGTGTTQGRALVRFLKAGGDLGIVTVAGAAPARAAVRSALADGSLSTKRLNEVAGRVLRHKRVDPCALG